MTSKQGQEDPDHVKSSAVAGQDEAVPSRAKVDDEVTGLPGLRSWRAVYLFVLGSFVLYVVVLAWFTRYYS